jgi:hypothetical protein
LLLGGAGGDHPTTPAGPAVTFPPGVGSRWVYDIVPSGPFPPPGAADTIPIPLVVTIVATDTIPPGTPATVWVYERPSLAETLYATAQNNTVRFHRRWAPTDYSVVDQYVLPLQVGASWARVCGRDSVVGRGWVHVPAGDFPRTYRINVWWGCVNSYGSNMKWFESKIGLVQYERNEFDLGPGPHELWQLRSADLRP